MNHEDFFRTQLAQLPVIAILRGLTPEEAVSQAGSAWDLGVRLVEVTLQDEGGYAALAAVVAAAPEGYFVGAGTVTSVDQLRRAREHGARFGIAPGLDAETVAGALDGEGEDTPFLPGVATASEVQTAQRLGARMVKAFPASLLTPQWFTAMAAPFPRMGFIATGGVSADNAGDFLAAGAVGVAVSATPGSERLARVCEAVRPGLPASPTP